MKLINCQRVRQSLPGIKSPGSVNTLGGFYGCLSGHAANHRLNPDQVLMKLSLLLKHHHHHISLPKSQPPISTNIGIWGRIRHPQNWPSDQERVLSGSDPHGLEQHGLPPWGGCSCSSWLVDSRSSFVARVKLWCRAPVSLGSSFHSRCV